MIKQHHISHPWMIALLFCALITSFPLANSNAQSKQDDDIGDYARDFYLGYIETGSEDINELSFSGLAALAQALNRRTSAEPVGVKAIDLDTDELSFFPIIYWPVTDNSPSLSAAQISKTQNYLDHGGMILFDIQDSPDTGLSDGHDGLKRLLAPINVAPLQIAPKEHAIRKSFYLLEYFSDDYPENDLWVEEKEDNRIADAGSVLIGNHDWASSWASSRNSMDHEMSIRFGVNLIMYALTGNYKTDQVHVQHILERLGE